MPSTETLITLIGPTASGKTKLAVQLAKELNAEIVSADSRQVYRGMDIGTGKDLSDYSLNGERVPFHLIDIVEAGSKYNVFEFQRDFLNVWQQLQQQQKQVVVCGGTGLYVESILRGYRLIPVPENLGLRSSLADKTLEELSSLLKDYKTLHNTTDVDTVKRAIRAIEIEEYYQHHPTVDAIFPKMEHRVFCLTLDRDERRKRITNRLKLRLDEGMIQEVEGLLNRGIPAEDLIYYGLEYKYVTLYITGVLSYQDMFQQLEVAIHQFAKRQMTWFRGMETRGIQIHWLNALDSVEENVQKMVEVLNRVG